MNSLLRPGRTAALARLRLFAVAAGSALLFGFIPGAFAADTSESPTVSAGESTATDKKKAQKRAGLRFGSWSVDGIDEGPGVDSSESPTIEGYFERDLDVRLSIESTVGIWRRTVESTESDFSGTTTERSEGYVVPIFTTLKFYPLRHDRRAVSPYINAGIGLALGMEKTRTTGGSGGIGGLNDGSSTHTGYGYNAGAGVDWSFGRSLGLSFAARYQNLRLDQAMSGNQYFKGYVIAAGATYRFQHD